MLRRAATHPQTPNALLALPEPYLAQLLPPARHRDALGSQGSTSGASVQQTQRARAAFSSRTSSGALDRLGGFDEELVCVGARTYCLRFQARLQRLPSAPSAAPQPCRHAGRRCPRRAAAAHAPTVPRYDRTQHSFGCGRMARLCVPRPVIAADADRAQERHSARRLGLDIARSCIKDGNPTVGPMRANE